MEGFEQNGNYENQTDYYSYGQNEHTDTYGRQTEEGEGMDGAYRVYEEPPKPKKQRSGMAGKFAKLATLAVTGVFVAGIAFFAIVRFFGSVTGNELFAKETEPASWGEALYIAEATETLEISSGSLDADAGAVTDVSEIVDQTMPSIVSITTIERTQIPSLFFGGIEEREEEGCGSGIIVSQDEENLYIATNNHVVAGAQTLTVLFSDSSTVTAKVKGSDSSSDLAVLSVPLADIGEETKEAIRMAVFGNSEELQMGQTAIAIGNALGYGQSVTTGVISAVGREVSVTNENDGSTITNELLQTSAAINPGNSGGALLNLNGEVVGITSVKYSETSVEGMGYAIPARMAIPIIKQLITRELVRGSQTSYLGISGVDVTDSVADSYSMPKGFYVASVVEGSSAAQAGILRGDIITRFDGRNVKSMEEIQELMRYLPAGTSVEVTLWRAKNGKYEEQTLEVLLGSKR